MSTSTKTVDSSLLSSSSPREKISAFVICFNEEADISACLNSITFCDEIVVIDSFSNDRTVEIAKEYLSLIHI